MRFLVIGALSLILAGHIPLPPLEEHDASPEMCKTFVERNRSCHEVILSRCNTTLRARLVQQIDSAPAELQATMRQEMDDKLKAFCASFAGEITAEKAVISCRAQVGSDDPEVQAQVRKMRGCMAKSSCEGYADCALEFH